MNRGYLAVAVGGLGAATLFLGCATAPSDVEISAKRILKMKETLLKILAENCNQPFEKVAEDCDRDYWLDADEAKAYGIVDEVI